MRSIYPFDTERGQQHQKRYYCRAETRRVYDGKVGLSVAGRLGPASTRAGVCMARVSDRICGLADGPVYVELTAEPCAGPEVW